MTFKKTATIMAAVAVLSAAAIPAMALENEFKATYTFKTFLSNFNNGRAGDVDLSTPAASAVSGAPAAPGVAAVSAKLAGMQDKNKPNEYAEQRARLFYTAKANDDVKLVTAFEFDTRFGGIADYKYAGSSDAGVLDTDGINLETKWIYLDFNASKNVNVKTGLMPYKDSIKGLFFDGDTPAIVANIKLDPLTVLVGASRFSENELSSQPTSRLGDAAKDLFILDTSYVVNKDLKAGFSYYILADYQSTSATTDKTKLLHTLAVNAEAKVASATISGFAAIQTGSQDHSPVVKGTKQADGTDDKTKYSGYALNVTAKQPVGTGTAKCAFLYTSGDDGKNNTNTAWQGSGVQNYGDSGLIMMVRNNAATGTTNTSEFLRRTINNIGLISLGYDLPINAKAFVGANLGLGWAPSKTTKVATSTSAATEASGSYIGSELALDGGYKVLDNLTVTAQLSYIVLGDYYKDRAGNTTTALPKTPENPYTARVGLAYTF